MLRCHSYADGYWADIARTYHIGRSKVDQIARIVFESHDLGAAFKHPASHGAGFGVLDHTARPRLHPKSDDVLEAGMILKLEPGAYLEEHGGVRKSGMVAVTEDGAEVLTPFHWNLTEVTLNA